MRGREGEKKREERDNQKSQYVCKRGEWGIILCWSVLHLAHRGREDGGGGEIYGGRKSESETESD